MSKRVTTKDFIAKARAKHGDKYDYSKVDYKKAIINVTITCPKHGDFQQRPANHLTGYGCPACGGNKRVTLDEFLSRARKKHGNRYGYSNVNFKNVESIITIDCPEHGQFNQRLFNHLKGFGCPKCGWESSQKIRSHDTERFIIEAKKIHGGKYDYSQSEYTTALKKVKIICPKHGLFEQPPANHTKGVGCPFCAESGFNFEKPAIVYYLAVTSDSDETFYKIGITNKTIEQRYSLRDQKKIKILKRWYFDIGFDAKQKEQEILLKYKRYKYHGPPLLESGNTEIFVTDILNKDN
jgi:hypothetical protein